MNNYFSIGKIVSAFGLDGELVMRHSLGKKTTLKGVAAIFLEEHKNSFIPYFPQKITAKDHEHVYVKLEGVDTKEMAQKLVKTQVYLAEADFKQHTAAAAPLALLGFAVEDQQRGPLGVVEEVIEMPMQVLVKVMIQGKEALLPINEQSLLKIDKKAQIVFLDLPDGLIDLYID